MREFENGVLTRMAVFKGEKTTEESRTLRIDERNNFTSFTKINRELKEKRG